MVILKECQLISIATQCQQYHLLVRVKAKLTINYEKKKLLLA